MSELVEVCIPNTKRDSFTYQCGDWHPAIGARVWVPFRAKTCLGVVIAPQEKTNLAASSLKIIAGLIDDKPFLSESLLDLCLWVSQYYQSPLSEVITLALPKHYRNGGAPVLPLVDYYQLSVTVAAAHKLINKRASRQHELIDFLTQQVHAVSQHQLREAGFATCHLKPLLANQIVKHSQHPLICTPNPHTGTELPLLLNDEQAYAVAQISTNSADNPRFLLHGTTGSGKTEIYLQIIAKTLTNRRQVLVIVPEIGLTPQLVSRFRARFKEPLVVIHSNLTEQDRQLAWYQASSGEAQLVIGTRTAIFTPMPNLALIVIDEEHDSSLKQQEGVRYSARDTALMRAHKAKIPIILGSATPSLESLHNCEQQKYILLQINRQAIATIPLQWLVTDLRNTSLQQGLAPSTIKHIERHLQQGNQVLVFINRRGFSPVLLCHQCGWIADCPACDSHLTLHRQDNRLMCH
ncbi:MAG: primosomal protein N', partial [Legionellales bacterium RIFCSPHIGHO2_12_FULL_42_9]